MSHSTAQAAQPTGVQRQQLQSIETTIQPAASRIITVAQAIGFIFGLGGALLLALKIEVSGWAYVPFLLSDIAWIIIGLRKKLPGLIATHFGYGIINVIGMARWLF